MPGLKEVRIRIASVKSTQQITNAMKMVAASKFRKAQTAIVKLRPYAARIKDMLQNLNSGNADASDNPFAKQREPEKVLLVVIASNRGLCGAFNSNIIKATLEQIHTTYAVQEKQDNVKLICIGRKVSEFFTKRKYNVIDIKDELLDHISFDATRPISMELIRMFLNKEYDRIILVYNQFKNAAVQRLQVEQFLPILPAEKKEGDKGAAVDFIYEPDQETILRELIPHSLRTQFYNAILDSFASEQGARMTAMQKATENAQDLLKELQLTYNKARQAAITKEILEIVSGAEALKG
jgi:F-type H+-transporting ATPase subunit gamma